MSNLLKRPSLMVNASMNLHGMEGWVGAFSGVHGP
jgi:hypothetical protein